MATRERDGIDQWFLENRLAQRKHRELTKAQLLIHTSWATAHSAPLATPGQLESRKYTMGEPLPMETLTMGSWYLTVLHF